MPSTDKQLPRVAYYTHHHGSGHLRHAVAIAGLQAVDLLVTGSVEPPGLAELPHTRFVPLTGDTAPDGEPFPVPGEPFLHYAPTTAAIRQRFAELHAAWRDFDPQVVIIDVSAEAAIFARLCGYPVLYRRMPGTRSDLPHELAYASAAELLAYYPRSLEDPAYLRDFGHRTEYLGMLDPMKDSPPDLRAGERPGSGSHGGNVVVVQTSLGGGGVSLSQIARAARSCPEWQWRVVGLSSGTTDLPPNVHLLGVLNEPGPELAAADIIVSSAGYHAVAAAAAATRPTILIPENRPFDEQLAFARALTATAHTPMADTWAAASWPDLLRQASASDPRALRDALFVSRDRFRDRLLEQILRVAAAA